MDAGQCWQKNHSTLSIVWNDEVLHFALHRLSTGYAAEQTDKISAEFKELKGLAQRMQDVGLLDLKMEAAELDLCFSTFSVTSTMSDQCNTQKSTIRQMQEEKAEKVAVYDAAVAQDAALPSLDPDLLKLEPHYCVDQQRGSCCHEYCESI